MTIRSAYPSSSQAVVPAFRERPAFAVYLSLLSYCRTWAQATLPIPCGGPGTPTTSLRALETALGKRSGLTPVDPFLALVPVGRPHAEIC
jgi:hypothetical protein